MRFRTPVKDPEELTYIFVAIAVGLGLGANQVLVTIVGFSVITIVLVPALMKRSTFQQNNSNYIDIVLVSPNQGGLDMVNFTGLLDKSLKKYQIKRVTETESRHEVTIELTRLNMANYEDLKEQLSQHYEVSEISIIDNARVIT